MIEMEREEVEAMLQRAPIGRIAFARSGEPYCIPMPFLYWQGALYFRLPLDGRKGEMLAANPQVCFETDEFAADLSAYASVIAEGALVAVTDLGEKAEVRRRTGEKYTSLRGGNRPGHGRPPQPLETLPLRKMEIRALSGRRK